MTERIDWDALMRLGLGQLRLPPEVFWAMTPKEFSCAVEGAGLVASGAAGGLRRGELETLMGRFPDAAGGQDEG